MSPIMFVHIAAGTLGLATGAAALLARKGGSAHRLLGTAFFASMMVMAVLGAYIAATMPQRGTMLIGVLTAYLVATSWATARKRAQGVDWFDYAAPMVGIAAATIFVMFGLQAAANPNGKLDAFPSYVHYPFAAIAGWGALCDMKVLLQRGIAGPARVSRHIWRMCTALTIGTFAFFFGQQNIMPEWMKGSPFLFAPTLLVLAAMIFWLIRVRIGRRFRPAVA